MSSVTSNRLEVLLPATEQNIVELIPPDAKRVVDIACNNHNRKLVFQQINPATEYLTIAEDDEAAEQEIAAESVDCLVYIDVLDNTTNPWKLLQRHLKLLKPGGHLLATFQQALYWKHLLKLLQGEGSVNPLTISDSEPRRLFGVKEIVRHLEQAGLVVHDLRRERATSESCQILQQTLAPLAEKLRLSPSDLHWQLETERVLVRSAKEKQPAKRVLVRTLIRSAEVCADIRVLEPNRFSNTIPGVRTLVERHPLRFRDFLEKPAPEKEKIFIWQRAILVYPTDLTVIREILRRDYLIIAELDDHPIRQIKYQENRFLTFTGSHALQTSTEAMAQALRQHNPNVAVFPNQMDHLPPLPIQAEQPIQIFFGALNRTDDWPEIMPGLNEFIEEYGERLYFQVIADRKFYDNLNTSAKTFTDVCDYRTYRDILSRCHIGLLPLQHNIVNAAKSDLKFLEHASLGTVAIASPCVYEQTIQDGQTGLLYRSAAEFADHFRMLIEDPDTREQIRLNAYNWVRDNRLLAQHYRQRYDWYMQMRSELPRLNAELKARVPELFAN